MTAGWVDVATAVAVVLAVLAGVAFVLGPLLVLVAMLLGLFVPHQDGSTRTSSRPYE